ncbi:MAG TPA: hypothetical protein VFE05_23465 [Longimicrobiaceae bacterium]|jgi:hypothetical protein|nr:hypothetical protein [Longimicrobiaceae bacterium]
MDKKLKLDAESLDVESFRTAEHDGLRGTVVGQATLVKTCAASCHCTSVDIGCWCTEAC